MKVPPWVAGGIAIVSVGSVLWGAATPSLDRDNPEHATKQELQERRFVQERRRRELEDEARRGIDASLARRDQAAEVRAAERAAKEAAEREAARTAARNAVKGLR